MVSSQFAKLVSGLIARCVGSSPTSSAEQCYRSQTARERPDKASGETLQLVQLQPVVPNKDKKFLFIEIVIYGW
jgi:hypothetical protein